MAEESKDLYGSIPNQEGPYFIPKPEISSILPNSGYYGSIVNAELGGVFSISKMVPFPTEFASKNLFGSIGTVSEPITAEALITKYSETIDLYGLNATVAASAYVT